MGSLDDQPIGNTEAGIRSLAAVLLLMSIIAGFLMIRPPGNVIAWDTYSYYLYLPAFALHNDPGLQDTVWLAEAQDKYNVTGGGFHYQADPLENGSSVIKVSMGLSVLWAPFFGMGHVWAGATGAAQDGFSTPYQKSLIIGGLLYLFIGLMVLRRTLSRFFSDGVVAITLLLLGCGTNWLHNAFFGLGMPHVLLFNFMAVLLWNTIRWHESHKPLNAVGIAIALGLLVLSRPTEIVAALLPLLWGMPLNRRSGWRERWCLFGAYKRQVIAVFAILFLFAAPQMLYWKHVTGHWVYMSYSGAAEGFDFIHPHLLDVLFSFRKGWFIYTPLMAVAAIGLVWWRPAITNIRPAVVAFLIVNLWTIASWSNWWYATSFGQRALVESYAIMALPLGAVIQRLSSSTALWRWFGAAGLGSLLGLNLFQMVQFDRGVIDGSRMSFPYYVSVFGRMDVPEGAQELLIVDHINGSEEPSFDPKNYHRTMLRTINAQNGFGGSLVDSLAQAGVPAMLLDSADTFTPGFHEPFNDVTEKDHVWVRATMRHFVPLTGPVASGALVFTMEHRGDNYGYVAKDLPSIELVRGAWNETHLMRLSPEIRSGADPVIVYYWHRSSDPAFVGSIQVEVFERNDP